MRVRIQSSGVNAGAMEWTHLSARRQIYDSTIFAIFELLHRVFGGSECAVVRYGRSALTRDNESVTLTVYCQVLSLQAWQLQSGGHAGRLWVIAHL